GYHDSETTLRRYYRKALVGKSSVIEFLSGIRLPRSLDITTRCPYEIRTHSSTDPYYCQISIRRSCSSEDEIHETPFSNKLKREDDIELMLLRAQFAVLRPHCKPETFLNLTWTQITCKQPFTTLEEGDLSRDVICVDVFGPNAIDMTYLDLPGVVSSGKPRIAKGLDDLVISHIKEPNVLILVASAMNGVSVDYIMTKSIDSKLHGDH
ncbi:hypothetical protein FRC02_002053, partial [Tulasnella sp. 418]